MQTLMIQIINWVMKECKPIHKTKGIPILPTHKREDGAMASDSPRCRYFFFIVVVVVACVCFCFCCCMCFFGVLLLLHACVFGMQVCFVGCWCVCGRSFSFPNCTYWHFRFYIFIYRVRLQNHQPNSGTKSTYSTWVVLTNQQ